MFSARRGEKGAARRPVSPSGHGTGSAKNRAGKADTYINVMHFRGVLKAYTTNANEKRTDIYFTEIILTINYFKINVDISNKQRYIITSKRSMRQLAQ